MALLSNVGGDISAFRHFDVARRNAPGLDKSILRCAHDSRIEAGRGYLFCYLFLNFAELRGELGAAVSASRPPPNSAALNAVRDNISKGEIAWRTARSILLNRTQNC
jgi:hypothetical protein